MTCMVSFESWSHGAQCSMEPGWGNSSMKKGQTYTQKSWECRLPWVPLGGLATFWGVDGGWGRESWGELRGSQRRREKGNCGGYVKWIKKCKIRWKESWEWVRCAGSDGGDLLRNPETLGLHCVQHINEGSGRLHGRPLYGRSWGCESMSRKHTGHS